MCIAVWLSERWRIQSVIALCGIQYSLRQDASPPHAASLLYTETISKKCACDHHTPRPYSIGVVLIISSPCNSRGGEAVRYSMTCWLKGYLTWLDMFCFWSHMFLSSFVSALVKLRGKWSQLSWWNVHNTSSCLLIFGQIGRKLRALEQYVKSPLRQRVVHENNNCTKVEQIKVTN